MSTLQASGMSQTRALERRSLPLIDSINQVPYGRVREDETYVVSGKAMNEIIDELRKLWSARETLADRVKKAQTS